MATLSSILAWEIARTEEPGGLQSMGLLPGKQRCLKPASVQLGATCWEGRAARVPSQVSAPGRGLPSASSLLTLTESPLHARSWAV